ncbi:s-adenosyl-L-methionine-dependent tRNA 4-demethylwyosine synthase TYW1 [Caerostris extrusa]|uniref:S-adenosyl-L-methionine-dependent tRNA 4-demethylwyosine synthase TYW1 n=1 Tax=Caerostris extrusa TaxID=172846 RepID=A0AAV4MY91_CAEEX|nr:s-adenosyl-L-methionine-dependent tRNA 4-demethylwyosine synthase TYW1 [Caerostris extrusa]
MPLSATEEQFNLRRNMATKMNLINVMAEAYLWIFGIMIPFSCLIAYIIQKIFQVKYIQKPAVLVNKKIIAEKSCSIIFGTQTGNAKNFAEQLKSTLMEAHWKVITQDMKHLKEPEEYLITQPKEKLCIFLVSTYVDGLPPDDCAWFCKWLKEASCDFRVSRTTLKGLKYAVFGLGNSSYGENFNKVAVEINAEFSKLGASSILNLVKADENDSDFGLEEVFVKWRNDLMDILNKEGGINKESSGDNKITYESSSEEEENENIMDLEDLGNVYRAAKSEVKEKQEPKEMITPLLRKSLTKQGYKLLGSHSGVKMCRWTKSMLRGRGGCYKHTFYGIESHRCMETTPSLACANKCVFCWRHHTNPVGTEWKWKMDGPDEIVELALKNHCNMINEFKGVPGVQPDKFAEGMEPKHCALSLVGEPIMYPEINTLIKLLHAKGISTFLVTNAQFPEAIRKLEPVTQLYVSVDASNEQSLKKIDRPLFRDFWQRFLDSLEALASKGQRTVYRLTLVKAWNTDELEGYAKLVQIGKPDFIEIKGVTYCGTSSASTLTMENIPWHEEVFAFSSKLTEYLSDYELASEHEHSNCILIANKRNYVISSFYFKQFKVDGKWCTWIDYDKFHSLMKNFKESEETETFTSLDYMYPTPDWAVIGAKERGFDPKETRFFRKNKKDISGC